MHATINMNYKGAQTRLALDRAADPEHRERAHHQALRALYVTLQQTVYQETIDVITA
ncbi:hypothetical protein ACIBQX_19300 [Nonomuraea sp. NPDC049714]|uniref:hypothetical protein n=1 Tax=Nonomuraea sp. NPDC049714 TaxID=3364357 RepID=UPI0037B136FC